MNVREKELLLRAALDELGPGEEAQVKEILGRVPGAARELEELKAISSTLAGAPQASFEPFFTTRVMQRVRSERDRGSVDLAELLARQFFRVAPAALVAVASIIAFNLVTGQQGSDTPLEAALGIPSVTMEAAYDYDPTYFSVDAAETSGEG